MALQHLASSVLVAAVGVLRSRQDLAVAAVGVLRLLPDLPRVRATLLGFVQSFLFPIRLLRRLRGHRRRGHKGPQLSLASSLG